MNSFGEKLTRGFAGNLLRDEDEAARVAVGQAFQQDGVDHAEDGGVRAHAESEGEHGDQHETRALGEGAEGEAEVLQEEHSGD